MYEIWKYILKIEEIQVLEVPLHAKILSTESQADDIVVYALVNLEEKEIEQKNICVYGTGHVIPDEITDYQFLGTVKLYGGSLMFHVFYQ